MDEIHTKFASKSREHWIEVIRLKSSSKPNTLLLDKRDFDNNSKLSKHETNNNQFKSDTNSNWISKVEFINLSHYRLTSVPTVVAKFKFVKQLDLSHNFLTDICHIFTNRRLTEINVAHNNLQCLNWLKKINYNTHSLNKYKRAVDDTQVIQSPRTRPDMINKQQLSIPIDNKTPHKHNVSDSNSHSPSLLNNTLQRSRKRRRGSKSLIDTIVNRKDINSLSHSISPSKDTDSKTTTDEIQNRESVPGLTRLDAGCNSLWEISILKNFCDTLKFLSLECNCITDITVVKHLRNMISLNVSYNMISTSINIFALSTLNQLAVFDLTGNEVTQMDHYRHYSIFCINSLKILDGCNITDQEKQEAKSLYQGKLHKDFLISKIGHSDFDQVKTLQIEECSLTILDGANVLSPKIFSSLKYLILDSNNLSDLTPILDLKSLVMLSANYNQIKSVIAIHKTTSAQSGNKKHHNSNCSTRPRSDKIKKTNSANQLVESGRKWNPTKQRSNSSKDDEVQGLNKLVNLETLKLGFNKIASIALLNIHGLQKLKRLSLPGNQISDVSGLYNLPSLSKVNVNFNKIRRLQVNAFSYVGNSLTELHIESNGLRTLESFNKLHNIKLLNFRHNRIPIMSEFKSISKLDNLHELYCIKNPVVSKPGFVQAISEMCPTVHIVDNQDLTRIRDQMSAEKAKMEELLHYTNNSQTNSSLGLRIKHLSFNNNKNNQPARSFKKTKTGRFVK